MRTNSNNVHAFGSFEGLPLPARVSAFTAAFRGFATDDATEIDKFLTDAAALMPTEGGRRVWTAIKAFVGVERDMIHQPRSNALRQRRAAVMEQIANVVVDDAAMREAWMPFPEEDEDEEIAAARGDLGEDDHQDDPDQA